VQGIILISQIDYVISPVIFGRCLHGDS